MGEDEKLKFNFKLRVTPADRGWQMSDVKRSEDSRYDLGLLFTDGLPEMDDTAGYRGTVAARAAGISYRQLDYWARTQLVEPTVRGAAGSGSQRLYGFRDILVLKLVKRLLDTGISLQQIRTAVNQLRESGVNDLAPEAVLPLEAVGERCREHPGAADQELGVIGLAGVGRDIPAAGILVEIRLRHPRGRASRV